MTWEVEARDMSTAYEAHHTAIVDSGAVIGRGTRVWHFCHICANSTIGEDCVLGQNVYVGNDVRIGNKVRIQNNVSVYDRVTLEDDVFCGPSMVFTNVINPRSHVPRKNEFLPTVVRRGATLGANCTVLCGVTVGRYAFVGAGAVVTRDLGDYELVVGVPARRLGWMSRHGQRLEFPLAGNGEARCPATGERYSLIDGRVSCAPGEEA
jgi:UDP-2-acetamido-3-amino-2,3-dideoxy-glucuronate N-acetyltransferase